MHMPICIMGRKEPEGILSLFFILQRKMRLEQLKDLLKVTL